MLEKDCYLAKSDHLSNLVSRSFKYTRLLYLKSLMVLISCSEYILSEVKSTAGKTLLVFKVCNILAIICNICLVILGTEL